MSGKWGMLSMALALALCGLAGPSPAQPQAEHLIAPMPEGFKVLGKDTRADGAVTEIWQPIGQTDKNWTEQIAIRTLPNKAAGSDPVALLQAIDKQMPTGCKDSAAPARILPGKTNGYATATMLTRCAQGPDTGKPESMLFHAIKGTDNLYLVIRAAHFEATGDQVKQWIRYVGSVRLCDDRNDDHPCRKPL